MALISTAKLNLNQEPAAEHRSHSGRSTEEFGNRMNRILVTGNAGSGKSTVARRISALLGIPCYSLDNVVWQSGWKKTPQAEKTRRIHELIQADSWVIDGVSYDVQSSADVVVFLDVLRRVSFCRVMKRNWKYLFRSRPELPPGCPEVLIIPTLCRIIWNFPKTIRPHILERAHERRSTQRFFHVKSEADLMACLAALKDMSMPIEESNRAVEATPLRSAPLC